MGRCVIKDKNNPYVKNLDRSYWANMKETTVYLMKEEVQVELYETIIFRFNTETNLIDLETGGWNSPLTLKRINQCLKYFLNGYIHAYYTRRGKEERDTYTFGGERSYSSRKSYEQDVNASSDKLELEDINKGTNYVSFRFVIPPAADIDWRPGETIPEDYYAY